MPSTPPPEQKYQPLAGDAFNGQGEAAHLSRAGSNYFAFVQLTFLTSGLVCSLASDDSAGRDSSGNGQRIIFLNPSSVLFSLINRSDLFADGQGASSQAIQMRRLLRFSVYHPRALLALVALPTICASLYIPRVHLQLDARSLIPSDAPVLAESDAASAVFGLRDVVVVGVATEKSIYDAETLAQVRRLGDGLARIDGVIPSSVTSVASAPSLLLKDEKIDMRPLLAKDSRGGADAGRRVRQEVESLGLNDGILVSPDGRAAAIFCEIRPDANREMVLQKVKALTARETNGRNSIYLSGTALAQAVLGQSSAQDLARLIPLVIVVLAIGLTIAFKTPVPAIVSLLEIGVSMLLTVGLMGLSGQSVFVTTLVLPVILVSVGISDDVYALKCYLKELEHAADRSTEQIVFDAFGSLIRPICLTTISTVVGLSSLAFTGLEPLRVFGLFGSLSIIFSTLLTFSLVPALLVLIAPRALRSNSRRTEAINKGSGIAAVWRVLTAAGAQRILAGAAMIAVCAVLLTTRLRVDDSWIRNLPAQNDVTIGDKALNNLMAGTTTLNLMIDSGRRGGFLHPQFLLLVAELEESLRSLPFVGATHSVYNEILRLNASLRGLSYKAYRDALFKGELQLEGDEIEQSLLLSEAARRSPMNKWIDSEYRRARISVFIRSADYERIDQVLQAVSAGGDQILSEGGSITPFGDGWISYTTVGVLVEGQVRSIGLALLTDLLLLSLLWRSFKAGLIAIIPVAFSVLVVFACLALSGISLGIANTMFTGVTIGIGLDFAIHLMATYRREREGETDVEPAMRRALMRTGPAIITSAAAITLGFSVLTLSQITPTVQLGATICLSLAVCAVTTLLLVPSLVQARRTAGGGGEEA